MRRTKSIAIIGEGETEWFYFDSLRVACRYMPGYEKTRHYFRRNNLYKYLTTYGNLDLAMKNAEILSHMAAASPKDHLAYSQMHQVLKLLWNMNGKNL